MIPISSMAEEAREDRDRIFKAVLEVAHQWIHNNPSATEAQATTALGNWLAAQGYESLPVMLIRILKNRLGEGTWSGLVTTLLGSHASTKKVFAESAYRGERKTPGELLFDALLASPDVTRSKTVDGDGYLVRVELYSPSLNLRIYRVAAYDKQSNNHDPLWSEWMVV